MLAHKNHKHIDKIKHADENVRIAILYVKLFYTVIINVYKMKMKIVEEDIMDDKTIKDLEEYMEVKIGLDDVKAGNTKDGKKVMEDMFDKYFEDDEGNA